jgi:hypothetical protein
VKVGWLHDDPGYLGGAELTMREFRAAAPEGVEIVDCLPGEVEPERLDRYVVGNCQTYPPEELPAGPTAFRYHHDLSIAPGDDRLDASHHIFCSPAQRERMGLEGECIPPALDLAPFEAVASQNHRQGAVCIGRMAYGKGLQHLAEFSEPVDVYSSVPCASEGNARYRGATSDVADTLSRYQRFVFAPDAFEPFGRAVVEAWAAGLTLVVNKNIGAMHYILNDQDALRSAGRDFWDVVTS